MIRFWAARVAGLLAAALWVVLWRAILRRYDFFVRGLNPGTVKFTIRIILAVGILGVSAGSAIYLFVTHAISGRPIDDLFDLIGSTVVTGIIMSWWWAPEKNPTTRV